MAKKYKLEVKLEEAVEKIGNSLSYFIKKAADYLFTIPKRKDDKLIYMFELIAWFSLSIALVLRIGR